jgi:hypothetical protein
MKTTIAMLAVILMMAATTSNVSAQGSTLAPAPKEAVTISPKMKLSDVKAVSQFIQGVEIRGTEVDAYLNTRTLLIEAATAAEEAGKKDEDVISCEMRLDQAQNLFTLMQRGTLKGVEAEKWKEIVEALREAVKGAQEAAK